MTFASVRSFVRARHRSILFGLLLIGIAGRLVACIKSDSEVLIGKQCPCADDLGFHCMEDGTCKPCPAGQVWCGGIGCHDLSTDPSNCGTCGKQCTIVDGAGTCSGGQCAVVFCEGDKIDCNGGLVCNLSGDPKTCGSCTNDCFVQFPNGAACAKAGFITRACQCDDDAGAGCLPGECLATPTGHRCHCSSDAGLCLPGEACATAPDGTAACSCNGGEPCGAPYRICCEDPPGCRTLVENDSCGACGRSCPPGFACTLPDAGGAPMCECTSDSVCNAGDERAICTPDSHLCLCTGAKLPLGACHSAQRCFAGGTCG